MIREIVLEKLRGVEIKHPRYLFTLHQGRFRCLPLFAPKTVERAERFQPVPDAGGRYTTTNRTLDEALGGGFRRGSFNLIETAEGVPRGGVDVLLVPLRLNFLAKGYHVFTVPAYHLNAEEVMGRLAPYVDGEAQKLVQIADADRERKEPYMIKFRGESALEDFQLFSDRISKSAASDGEPILIDVGYDTIEHLYPADELTLKRLVAEEAVGARTRGSLTIRHCRSNQKILAPCEANADIHIKMRVIDGSLCIYGVKPWTQVFHIDTDVSKGYPMIEVTPVE